jgi:hypothetical protein
MRKIALTRVTAATGGMVLFSLLGLWGWYAAHPKSAVPPRGDIGTALSQRVATQPKPALAHLQQIVAPTNVFGQTSQAVATPPLPASLSEAQLKPLRRAFVPPKIVARDDLPAGRQLLLVHRLIVASAQRSVPSAASGQQSATRRGTTPFVVQFDGPVTEAAREELTASGALLRGYIPNNAVLAELTPRALARLATLASVQTVTEYLPSDKVQPFLSSLTADFANASIQTTLQTLSAEDAEPVAAAVAAAGGYVTSVSTSEKQWGLVHAVLPLASLSTLASRGDVQWIEESVPRVLFNDKASIAAHLNTTNAWNTWLLTGKGQIVGHADTGLDTGNLTTLHPDFQGRIVALIALGRTGDASDTHGHGTHTAGSILGDGSASSGQYRGMAYQAGLVHESILDSSGALSGFNSVYDLFALSYAYGATIHSDSWGSDTYGAYDSESRSADLFAWNYPNHLAIFASGNAGTDANKDGVVDTGSVGSPATAKNVVAVGASENDRPSGSGGYSSYTWYAAWPSNYPTEPISSDKISYSATTSPYLQGMAAFSSRGPASDNRIKPDVTGPGTDVISTRSSVGSSSLWGKLSSNTRYCFSGGTSMATPLIAGSTALLRQYAVERGGVTNPSAALLKAMLVGGSRSLSPGQYGTGSTREIPDASPNNVEGWGQPDIANTVHPTNGMVRLFDRIAPAAGATNTIALPVTVSNTPLDVALAWIDYPATAGAGVTLVNDYDLQIVAPDGTVSYPNGGTARDSRNTVEAIHLIATQTGVYRVQTIGYNVPYAGGVAALYVRGAVSAPFILVHTALSNQSSDTPNYPVSFRVQSLSPLTNGEATVHWTTGTASAPTGAWNAAVASWSGQAAYTVAVPQQPLGTFIYYYLQATNLTYDVRLPASAPSSNFAFSVGSPIQVAVNGTPARYGTVSPSYGTNTLISGVSISFQAPASVEISNGVRQVCTGWTGTGDVPTSGTSNSVTLTLSQASSITWQWGLYYALTNQFRAVNYDWIFDQAVTWFAAGSSATSKTASTLVAINNVPYALASWYVDASRWPDASSTSANPASGIAMTRPHVARANYRPFWQDTDGNGLSDWWEMLYFGSLNSGVSASADLDGDGWTNLAEFLDNSDPRNPSSTPVPPAISVAPLDSFQTARSPWTVSAEITDNLSVEVAQLVWRERGASSWTTNAMTWVAGNTYTGTLDPPSHGSKRVDYFVVAGDLIGYYEPSLCSTSAVYHVIGDYDTPWRNVSPIDLGLSELSSGDTNFTLTVSNFAGPDLVWTARVAFAEAPFAVTNAAWSHSGSLDVWCITTNRTWNGDAVWYCGDTAARAYPNGCHAVLDTPPFVVGTGGGLLFRQWIQTEYDTGNHYWDGAVLRVSTDNGVSFTSIAPTTGYPYLITDNVESPFSADQPCLAGKGTGWETLLLDLSAYAGQTVIVRFEFGSDSYTTAEGWYIAAVTPFSFGVSARSWLVQQGTWGGTLADQWATTLGIRVDHTALSNNEEAVACLRFEDNDPTQAPIVPLTVRRGQTLTPVTSGPGTVTTDRTFLFRDLAATVTFKANAGGYLFAATVNGAPQPDVYSFATTTKTLTFTNPGYDLTVQGWYAYRTWSLTVLSALGSPSPAIGTYTYTHGTVINAYVISPITTGDGLTRYVCPGWTLSGHTPSSGAQTQIAFSLTNDATLAWLWSTNYWLSASAGLHGTVSPQNGWYPAGQSACVTASPDAYYHLSAWSGDTNCASPSGTRLTLPMTTPRSITAWFAATLTDTHGVPLYWLASHGFSGDFETAAESDADGDGMATWKEWYADTDPTNPLSLLQCTALSRTNKVSVLTWIGGQSRTQCVEWAADLSSAWHGIFTNYPPTRTTNTLAVPSPSETSSFYRVYIP